MDTGKLPKQVKDYMGLRFALSPGYLGELRCFQYEDVVDGRWAICLRIFSPNGAKEHNLCIKKLGDLEQHPGQLMFEGHIDNLGRVYIVDRRSNDALKIRGK